MCRALLTILFLIVLAVPALADETWTEETAYGDTYTYTREDTEWGYVTRAQESYGYEWIDDFKYNGDLFDACDDYVAVFDEAAGVETFYRSGWVKAGAAPEELAAFAETVLAEAPILFTHDRNRNQLILSEIGEIDLPAAGAVRDAYDRQQRLFMTIDTADGRHFLYIVTWQDGLDLRAIEIPWSGSFDSYHVGDSNDHFILHLDANVDFGYIVADEVEERWILRTINTGWDTVDVSDWGVRSEVYNYWAYGSCPWRDLETMDWNTLPLTYADAATSLNHQGWLFPTEETPLRAKPKEDGAVLLLLPVDTPLCLLRIEGAWAFVGAQAGQLVLDMEGEWWGPWVGYVPLAALSDMPQTVLPGGEICGWFETMQVEPGSGRYYDNSVTIRFASIDNWNDFIVIEVMKEFVEAARAVYREKGYAATPLGFDESLLTYLEAPYGYGAGDVPTIRDVVLTEDKILLAIQDDDGNWRLRICLEANDLYPTDVRMPGPFCFSREELADTWDYAIQFSE